MPLEIKYVGHTGIEIKELMIDYAQLCETVENQFLAVTVFKFSRAYSSRQVMTNDPLTRD